MSRYCRPCNSYCDTVATVVKATQTTRTASPQFSFLKYLGSEELTDVEFVVDSSHYPGMKAVFKAHRLVLALQNDVFKVMLCGDFSKEGRITITDLHPDGFLGVLRYFYSGELRVESVHQAFYTRTAAAKYLVPELAALCSEYVATHLTLEDVCPLLDNILTRGEHDTDEPARKLLRTQGNLILLSSSFKSCLECTVHYVLEHIGAVSEFALIGAVYEWAQQQILLRHPDEGEGLTARKLMQPFFTKLRFLALTPSEFVSGVNTWGIFNEKEALALLSNIIDYECVAVPHGFCKIREQRA